MIIHSAGTRPAQPGPGDYFTGDVTIMPLISTPAPARLRGVSVRFAPGARTAWHTHPLGQTIIITAGTGRVQRDGGEITQVQTGDVVYFEPGERHWHGATPDSEMTHIALQEELDGTSVTWLEQVAGAEYDP